MRPSTEVHDALARLLEYPREDYGELVEAAARRLASECPRAWESLAAFAEFVHDQDLGALEEGFAGAFDNTKERALEVGWHAFGENYTRGTFMVGIRGRLRECGITENGELPDHLSHVLALLGRADADWAGDMAADTVGPAVRSIHAALKGMRSPWADLLGAVGAVLVRHEQPLHRPVGSWIPTTPPLPTDAPAASRASSPRPQAGTPHRSLAHPPHPSATCAPATADAPSCAPAWESHDG